MNCILNIGTDRVCLEPERLIIHAAEPMDLPIREFCKVPVHFQGQKYYVRAKQAGERPCAVVYELWPWPPELHEASTQQLFYDEAYVTERNRMAATRRRHERRHWVLLPLYPLLGLCWSRYNNQVLGAWGFEPGSITNASIFLTFNFVVADGIFVGWLGGGILGVRVWDWALLFLLGADTVLRYGQSLQLDVEHHWGICEWMWPGRPVN